MKTVTVHVTKTGIKKGRPGSAQFCPVARGVKKRFGRPCVVDDTSILIAGKIAVRTPSRVARFIHAFDLQRPVEPFSFKLRVPAEARQ